MDTDEYLVVDDYGTGGIWAVMLAPSRAAVEAAYPDLKGFDDRPDWVDDAEFATIKSRTGFRFDEPNEYWSRFFRPSPST